jgi:hypothetical protein
MADTPKPSLTELVEQRLLSVIKAKEAESLEQHTVLTPENYLKLADLYHFHKSFKQEHDILNRYANLATADKQVLQDIYERIEHIAKTQHVLKDSMIEKALEKDEEKLTLMAIESEPSVVELASKAKVNLTLISPQTENTYSKIKFLTLCAVYTGKKATDEVVQVAFVLSEYSVDESPTFRILETYTGNRKPTIEVPARVYEKFSIKRDRRLDNELDTDKVIQLFEKADYVISHNNPDIERYHLVTLIPELANAQWYSSQKDIPWRALGFESASLSHIASEFGKRKPRTALERAKAITAILQHEEPSGGTLFFERICNMKPMKAIEVTEQMHKAHQKMTAEKSNGKLLALVVALMIGGGVVALNHFNVITLW